MLRGVRSTHIGQPSGEELSSEVAMGGAPHPTELASWGPDGPLELPKGGLRPHRATCWVYLQGRALQERACAIHQRPLTPSQVQSHQHTPERAHRGVQRDASTSLAGPTAAQTTRRSPLHPSMPAVRSKMCTHVPDVYPSGYQHHRPSIWCSISAAKTRRSGSPRAGGRTPT